MRSIFVLLAALFATAAAFPQNWLVSSLNSKKSCIIPVGYKPPAGAMMSISAPTIDSKNGPTCKITFVKATNTIIVTSNIAPVFGVLLNVSGGSLSKTANKTCASSFGPKNSFVWVPAPGAKASATCGDSSIAALHTTTNVSLA